MNKHEYEINQLINPKKDIVKSNSKHRDKIETLIQGRRIGGILGGGDTPKQETLWAIEFESGKFAFGHANENQIFVATSGIDREIWYADNNGFIAGSTESVDEVTGTIIDTYNEHFGTRISHLTPEAKTFNVGDIIKNWNAYEKIEMPSVYVAVRPTESSVAYIAGKVKGEIFTILANTESSCLIINDNGKVNTIYGPPPTMQALSYAISRLSANGISVTQTNAEISTLAVNDSVPNWESYQIIG